MALGGCATLLGPHVVTLMADDGTGGTGTASRSGASGTIQAEIEGEFYSGTYASARGGAVAYGSGSDGSFFNGFAAGTQSGGTAMLQSQSGGTLQCRFTYDGIGHAGYGECRDRAGKHYQLQIS